MTGVYKYILFVLVGLQDSMQINLLLVVSYMLHPV